VGMNALEMVEDAGFEPLAACDADDAIRLLWKAEIVLCSLTFRCQARGTGFRLARSSGTVCARWP
jgi:hypothetical protein